MRLGPHWGSRAAMVVLCLAALGCATAQPRVAPRAATEEDRRLLARALGPLLYASGIWRGREDGCAVALGVLPVGAINLGVGPHQTCKFGLLVTEGALQTLPLRELQAALAHELGHVQLGHFKARKHRREAEREAQKKIDERGATGGAVAAAIPVIGPLLAVGVMGTQVAAQTVTASGFRVYDRDEELAADRFAAELLDRVLGAPDGCRAVRTLLGRLDGASGARLWSGWLSTHPRLPVRGAALEERCP
jgi:Zn-dependent protease with chaperone function